MNVTLTAQNTGNVNANVTVTDTLPSGAKLISGETGFRQVLASGGGSKTISYIMQIDDEGEIQLPACKASFIDLDKYSGEVYSNTSVINVSVPISLEGNSTQSGGVTGSSQEKNGSSNSSQSSDSNESDSNGSAGLAQTASTEDDSGNIPGFGSFCALAGLLTVTVLLLKRKV